MEITTETATQRIESYVDSFYAILPNLSIGAVVLSVFVVGGSVTGRAMRNVLRRRDRPDLAVLLGGFAKWAVILLGFLVFAAIVFPSVKPADILATLGIGSVAIGFAFKDILQNWLSGLLILYRQPFHRGDQIRSGEFEGTVEKIEPRATLIRTYDGQRVVIPNSDIYTRAVVVRTAFQKRRSEYDLGIGYGDDVHRACDVILRALKDSKTVAAYPPPEAIPWSLDPSAVTVRVRWWTDSRRAVVVHGRGEIISTIKKALTQAGIDLPFPTRVVLFHDQTEQVDGDRRRQREGWPPSA